MNPFFFYAFAALTVGAAIALVAFRNPVSSALSMVVSFLGLAAIFIGLDAYFVGIIQILVYAGAIMVLFLFIIMLLDLKAEELKSFKPAAIAAGILLPVIFLIQLGGVLPGVPQGEPEPLALKKAAAHYYDEEAAERGEEQSEIHKSLSNGKLPDVNLIGLTMFGSQADNDQIKTPGYNFPLQIVGVLLLVATVGAVTLSLRRQGARNQ